MRTVQPLDALLGATRQKVLAETFRQPDRWWYLHELARTLGLRPSSLQRDLTILASAEILARRRDGNRVYYKANETSPIFPELRQLLLKTVALVDVLRDALQPLSDKVAAAFLYGSVAQAEARAASDVDLMVIGDVSLAEVAKTLRGISSRLGRAVNPTVYSLREFKRKRSQGHHFVTNVMAGKKRFLYGSDYVLG